MNELNFFSLLLTYFLIIHPNPYTLFKKMLIFTDFKASLLLYFLLISFTHNIDYYCIIPTLLLLLGMMSSFFFSSSTSYLSYSCKASKEFLKIIPYLVVSNSSIALLINLVMTFSSLNILPIGFHFANTSLPLIYLF